MFYLLFIACYLLFSIVNAEWVYHSRVYPLNSSDVALIDRMWKLTNEVGFALHPNLISLKNKYSDINVDIWMQKEYIAVLFSSKESFPISDSCNATFANSHVGFMYDKLYRTIRNSVHETVKSMLKASNHQKPIVASGKSVGGALAQLFAADVHKEWNANVKVFKGVILFDTPKVGTLSFSEELCKHLQCVRVTKEKSNKVYEYPKEKHRREPQTFALSQYEILYGEQHMLLVPLSKK